VVASLLSLPSLSLLSSVLLLPSLLLVVASAEVWLVSVSDPVVSALGAVAEVPTDVLVAASDASVVAVVFSVVSACVITVAVVAAAVVVAAVTAAAVEVTAAAVDVVPSDDVFRTALDEELCVVKLSPASSLSSWWLAPCVLELSPTSSLSSLWLPPPPRGNFRT